MISYQQLEEAVRRILRVKIRAGLFDNKRPSNRAHAGHWATFGGEKHAAIAREAVRKSAVLLKNNDQTLPLDPKKKIIVAGAAAHDLSKLCGGWTIGWQGQAVDKSDFPNSETLQEGVRRVVDGHGGSADFVSDDNIEQTADAAIVAFGEEPYAEFHGDLDHLDYASPGDRDLALLKKLKANGIPTIAVFLSGRPLWTNPEINASDAFIAAFLPGAQAGAIADLLFTANLAHPLDFHGRLPFAWPARPDQHPSADGALPEEPLFPIGFGLTYANQQTLPLLDESGAIAAPLCDVMRKGAVLNGWRAAVSDQQGLTPWRDGAPTISPGGAVSAATHDFGQQENSIAVSWPVDKRGVFVLSADAEMARMPQDVAVDIEMELALLSLGDGIKLTAGAADGPQTLIDLAPQLNKAPQGKLFTIRVPLGTLSDQSNASPTINEVALSASAGAHLVLSRIAFTPASSH